MCKRAAMTTISQVLAPSKNPTGNPFSSWKTFKLANKAGPLRRKDPWSWYSTSVREKKHRVRLDMEKVDLFVEFANRPHFYQDVAYGNKILKLDSGEKIQMPNVVPTVAKSTIINQYFEFCRQRRAIGTPEPINIQNLRSEGVIT